ncbi:MAG: RDD family protein [Bacteroidales bacterium]|nr:RDD family protein [Bacteroidales bacterium]
MFKIIIKLLIPVLYFGLITYLYNGYTLGKRIFKIRIVSTTHNHLTLWHSIERSIGYYASSLEFGFGFLQYFIDYNRRTVHDRIAETIVIKIKKLSVLSK